MIPVTTCAGKRVALFGLGGSGLVTAAALVAGGAYVVAWDDNPVSRETAAAQGVRIADLRDEDWAEIDLFVIAPGVPLTHPQPHWTVDLAIRSGVPIVGDVELFFREMQAAGRRAPVIAITGTNGKSTTTALIAHVLKSAGRDVQMGGNIGRAVLDLEPVAAGSAAANQVYVVEVSSYQIDTAPGIRPHVGLLLNITPDHLERHGTIENYAAIKERLVASADLAVVGIDDRHCTAICARLEMGGRKLERITQDAGLGTWDVGFDRGTGQLMRQDRQIVGDLSAIGSLRGPHNGQNAAAAFAACRAVGLSDEAIQAGFASFPGLAHRMEQVGRVGDVVFINDSKATNAEATAPALNAFDGVFWIAGGLAKDGGISALAPVFSHVAQAFLIGEAAGSFASQLGDTIPYEISGTLQHAVNHAAEAAREAGGERVVLLSPSAASFDQFANFERRGDAFREAVASLPGFQPIGD